MNRSSLVPLVILASSIAAIAATPEADPATTQLQVFPKNFARHHIGSNLFIYQNAKYVPTESAAAWLDDDITSGSAPLTGKQHYLLALPEPEVVTNFAISAQAMQGTVTIYAGDEPQAPGAKSWQPLVREVPLESINGKKLARPFSRLAKYLLLETNVTEPAPIYSLYLYGEIPAVGYQLVKRDAPIDVKAIFGPYVNDLTAISSAGLYAGGRVAFSTEPTGYTTWQKAIDDNPGTGGKIASSTDQAGMALTFRETQPVKRLAILSGNNAKGKLEVFVLPTLPQGPAITSATPAEGVQPASNVTTSAKTTSNVIGAVSLNGLTPTATFTFDGTNPRQGQDLTDVDGSVVLFRWTPETAGEAFEFQELDAFAGYSLSQYTVAPTLKTVAELTKDQSKDGKSIADGKDGKGLTPVGELFPRQTPYSPPALGFPPSVNDPLPLPASP
jgi:hypothetical protein